MCLPTQNTLYTVIHSPTCRLLLGWKQTTPFCGKDHLQNEPTGNNRWIWHLLLFAGCLTIQGNKRADWAAKKALNCDVEPRLITHSDLTPILAIHIKSKWQHEWDQNINKLHEIEPSKEKPPHTHIGGRRDEVVFSCCHIGHSWFPHAFLLKGDTRPECIGCPAPLILKHVSLDCVDFLALNQQFYIAGNMYDLFFFYKVKQEDISLCTECKSIQ